MDRVGDKRGVGLIQLITGIVLIAILSGIAISKFVSFRDEAYRARSEQNIGALRAGAQNYFVQKAAETGKEEFPPNKDTLEAQMLWPLEWGPDEEYIYEPEIGLVEME